ncbi:MAG: hypothetical protein WCS17_02340 [Prevotella sp.]
MGLILRYEHKLIEQAPGYGQSGHYDGDLLISLIRMLRLGLRCV